MTPDLETFDDLDALSRRAADLIAGEARRPFSLILPGGSTPRRLFELLGTERRERLPWTEMHLFWSDERFVPAGDEASNYGTAARLFVDRAGIPSENVHRVRTDLHDVRAAADAYEEEIRRYFSERSEEAFDLALLGLGADGHTASLFPGHEAASGGWAEAVIGPADRPPRERITLTVHALCAARTVVFLAAGREKQAAVRGLLEGDERPAGRIRGSEQTMILVDAPAAAEHRGGGR